MTEDITADFQGSPRLLIAFMDERDQFAHVCEAAMGLAKRSGARIILYDRDAASSWGDPLPTWWSAAGERAQYGDPLSEAELSKLDLGVLARMMAAARAEGVDAWGWLPAEHGTNHALDCKLAALWSRVVLSSASHGSGEAGEGRDPCACPPVAARRSNRWAAADGRPRGRAGRRPGSALGGARSDGSDLSTPLGHLRGHGTPIDRNRMMRWSRGARRGSPTRPSLPSVEQRVSGSAAGRAGDATSGKELSMERARPDRRLTDLADLADLLASVAEQQRLGRSQRDEADYWASQVRPALDIDDAQTIAWLLLDIAEHPLVPDQLCQRARAWATALERPGPRADRSAQGGRVWTS